MYAFFAFNILRLDHTYPYHDQPHDVQPRFMEDESGRCNHPLPYIICLSLCGDPPLSLIMHMQSSHQPLNHTAIYPNPCLGEKCWWDIPNIGQSLTCTTRLMITPGSYALPDGKNKIIVHPSTAINFIAYTPLGGLGGQNT